MAENQRKMRTIKDYEWASTCQYIVWVTARIGLRDVSADSVYSFQLSKHGVDKLRGIKKRAQIVLQENILAIETFVVDYREDIEQAELDVIRGVWRTNVQAHGTVTQHLVRLETLEKVMTLEFDYTDLEGEQDEIPF